MVTLETSPEANCDRETRQADRQKKTLIGARATVLPKNPCCWIKLVDKTNRCSVRSIIVRFSGAIIKNVVLFRQRACLHTWFARMEQNTDFWVQNQIFWGLFAENSLWWNTLFGGRCPEIEDYLIWKMNLVGRQLLIEDNLWWKNTLDESPPLMEDVTEIRYLPNPGIALIFFLQTQT